MASIKFFIKGTSNPTTIYLRLSAANGVLIRKSTSYLINPKFFNKNNGKIKLNQKEIDLTELNNNLENLKTTITTSYNTFISNGGQVNKLWLDNILDVFFDRATENELDYFVQYANDYIKKLPTKTNPKGGVGVAISTLKKYKTIRRKMEKYELSRKKKVRFTDIGMNFREDFLSFLLVDERLSMNTAGRDIKFLKTICLDAKRNGISVHKQLESIKGFTAKTEKVFLIFDEIEKIEETKFESKTLKNARDWLVMGCYLGQRVSDLLPMKASDIKTKGDLKVIELTQKKTKKKVSVLVHPKVIKILNSRGGEFPNTFSNNIQSNITLFNVNIKRVAKIAGLTYKVQGAKINPKTNRKESGMYEKWELVSSHICRRSFATNYYGDIPTPLLLSVTGHSTERDFLLYIGKSSVDYVENLAKYWGMDGA